MFLFLKFFILLNYIWLLQALECFQCTGDYEGIRCTDPCKGDMCVIWKWKTKSELLLKQGCLKGVDKRYTAKPGCRTNTLGATLCVCDDGDLCNRVERTENTIRSLPTISIPNVECSNRITGTDIYGSKRIQSCNSNYCHMLRTEIFYESSAPDVINVYNCADLAEFDFDVRLMNSINFPGLYPNGCYKVQTRLKETTTDCTCSKNNCNSGMPVIQSGPVRCYVGQNFFNDSMIEMNSFCDGDYCFIQKIDGKYMKGCLSVNERNTWSHIRIGHRHIVGVDQWLCQSHLCNSDILRWNRSITPYIASHLPSRFMNISSKSSIHIFYILILINYII